MKKLLIVIFGSFLFSLIISVEVSAFTFEAQENIVVDKTVFDDLYLVGANITVKTDVFGDLWVTGGLVTIYGDIHEDLVIAGGRAAIYGDVYGDVRVLGGQVAVYGKVGDDVLVAGGQVDIGKDSVVLGSLISGAGILTVDGEIDEDIRGVAGVFILNGKVNRDVIITVQDTASISKNSSIKGDFEYSAILEISIPDGVVGGTVSYNKFEKPNTLKSITAMSWVYRVLSFVSSLILALLAVIFFPKILSSTVSTAKENVLKCFGIGILTVIICTIGGLVLMITIVGIPLGLFLFAFFLIGAYFSKIFAAVWLSGYVFNYKKKVSKPKQFLLISATLLAFQLIGMLPYFGWIINAVFFLIGLGVLVLVKINVLSFLKAKNQL